MFNPRPVPPRSIIVGFLWRFALVYGLLLAPWPGFNAVYGEYLRAMGQTVLVGQGERRILRFEAVPADLHRVLDTRILLASRAQVDRKGRWPVYFLELDTRGIGWVPTALLLSLVLATPVGWRRKGWALLWGAVTVHCYILLSLAVHIWNSLAELSLITLNPLWKQVVAGLEETMITQMGASFVVPVLIWTLVGIRRQDLAGWRDGIESRDARVGSRRVGAMG